MSIKIPLNSDIDTVLLELSDCPVHRPRIGLTGSNLAYPDNERLLLLSNLEKPLKRKRRERTKNNKSVSLSEVFSHEGTDYPINNSPVYGVYLKILQRTVEQLNICIEKWKRVFVIRFDLHQKYHTPTNAMITRFRKNLAGRIERHYGIFEMGFVWVREHERAKAQHYHFAVYLDGDKIRHSSILSEMIRDTWVSLKAGNSVHIPKRCFYNVVDAVTKYEAVQRLSYLSKQRGKGYRPKQTNDYGNSRLIRHN